MSFSSLSKEEEKDFKVDAPRMVLTLGLALQELGYEGVTQHFVDSIRSMQTFHYAKEFQLPLPHPKPFGRNYFPEESLLLPAVYNNLNDLFLDWSAFSTLKGPHFDTDYENGETIVIIGKETALMDRSYSNGGARYLIKHEGNILKITCLGITQE